MPQNSQILDWANAATLLNQISNFKMKNNFNFDEFLSDVVVLVKEKETNFSDIQAYVKREKERLNREINEESPQFTAYVQQIGEFYKILTTGEGSVNLNLNKDHKKLIRSIVNKIDEVETISPPELRDNLKGNSFLVRFKRI